jgi:hypothetical protein
MEPATVPSPRALGQVTALLSTRPLDAQWHAVARRRALETVALVVALVFAAWVVLLRSVVRPLERIRAVMVAARRALASGPSAEPGPQDPVAGLPGALPELRGMGQDYLRLAEAVLGEQGGARRPRGRPARHPRLDRRRP